MRTQLNKYRAQIRRQILILGVVLFSLPAAAIELLVWQSDASGPRVILPLRDGESDIEAVRRYLHASHTHADLSRLLPSNEIPFSVEHTERLAPERRASRPRLAFIANNFSDMHSSGARIRRNLKTFFKAGADPYVIALSADLGLSEKEATEFRSKVAENFSMLVALGGDDVAEELSGRVREKSSETVLTRDLSEVRLISRYKEAASGFFFGICRGHQIGALADGHKIYEDLSRSGIGNTDDHVRMEGRNSTEMQTWHHIYVDRGSLLSDFLARSGVSSQIVRVNSVHHQAVELREGARSSPVARHETSGVEALELENGRGLSVQFHPEFPAEISGDSSYSKTGFNLIKNLVTYSRLLRLRTPVRSCQAIFQ